MPRFIPPASSIRHAGLRLVALALAGCLPVLPALAQDDDGAQAAADSLAAAADTSAATMSAMEQALAQAAAAPATAEAAQTRPPYGSSRCHGPAASGPATTS